MGLGGFWQRSAKRPSACGYPPTGGQTDSKVSPGSFAPTLLMRSMASGKTRAPLLRLNSAALTSSTFTQLTPRPFFSEHARPKAEKTAMVSTELLELLLLRQLARIPAALTRLSVASIVSTLDFVVVIFFLRISFEVQTTICVAAETKDGVFFHLYLYTKILFLSILLLFFILYDNLVHMAKTVIEVKKNPNENNSSVLRRFSRRIQESGIIRKIKGARYNVRKESKLKIKKSALKRMARRKEIEKLKKLGKMVTK